MMTSLTEEQWNQYGRDGYYVLKGLLDRQELSVLQNEIDAIMLGQARVPYERILMQLDSETGRYEDAGLQSHGFKGATLEYRKIQDLELDPVFMEYMQRPLFQEICARVYGQGTPIAIFRAMFMNKPAEKGTVLPWHQDRWTDLDRDPLITLWTALDPATKANGCVEVIPGSHHRGLLNPSHPSAFVTPEQAAELSRTETTVFLELEAGDVALLHNWLLHRSGVNTTSMPRRGFSVNYMDARTESRSGQKFTPVFRPTRAI